MSQSSSGLSMKSVTMLFRYLMSVKYFSLLCICILLLGLSKQEAFATANYVYHERSTNNPGCGGQYVSILNPASTDAVTIRFKVEYQFYTTNAALYYTTDGSNPSGAYGSPTGTTQVLNASWVCIFNAGQNVDVWEAAIPAQQGGKTIKYIISAWHSGGGAEIFANSGEFVSPLTTSAQATQFSYTVTCPTISLSPTSLSNGTQGSAYSQSITASGGTSSYTYAVTSGSLPAGLTLTSGGLLSGTPAANGTFYFDITATDANGCTAVKSCTLQVVVPPLAVKSIIPSQNASHISKSTDITVTFNKSVNTGTLIASNIVIGGPLSGRHFGSITLLGDTGFVFNPYEDFEDAENINVTITKNVQAGSGEYLTNGYHSLFIVQAQSGTGGFVLSNLYTINIGSQGITSGDWDKDGDVDLAVPVTNYPDNRMYIMYNDGTGHFFKQETMYVSSRMWRARSADIDNDGDLDIVANCNTADGADASFFYTFLNDGTGNFTLSPDRITNVGGVPHDFDLGDLDGDGDLDILLPSYNTNTASVLKNNGSGGFSLYSNFGLIGYGIVGDACKLADLNGDGYLDGVVGNSNEPFVRFLYNTGQGDFTQDTAILPGTHNFPALVNAGDFNGDGIVEVIAGGMYAGYNALLTNDGFGNFTFGFDLSNGGNKSVVTDVDGDGDLDFVPTNGNYNIGVYTNNGAGSFPDFNLYGHGGADPTGFTFGDLDGDGDPDLATANYSSPNVSVLFNDYGCPSLALDPPLSIPNSSENASYSQTFTVTGSVESFNFIISSGTLPPGLTLSSTGVLSGTTTTLGTYTFTVTAVRGNGCSVSKTYTIVVGEPPIAVETTTPSKNAINVGVSSNVSVEFNKALNTSSVTSSSFVVEGSYSGRYSGSISFSGDTLAMFNPSTNFRVGEQINVRLAKSIKSASGDSLLSGHRFSFTVQAIGGTGAFTHTQNIALGTSSVGGTAADLDNDGDIDLIAGTAGVDSFTVMLNNGSGGFTSYRLKGELGEERQVIVGDFDGDGDVDFVGAMRHGYNNNQLVTFHNDGTGHFPTRTLSATTNISYAMLTAGDWDGDMDLDLAVLAATYTQPTVCFLRNDGSGSFTEVLAIVMTFGNYDYTGNIVSFDFDNDGDLDVFCGNRNNNTTMGVFVNDGTGNFSTAHLYPGESPGYIYPADFDNDRDIDLVILHTVYFRWVEVLKNNGYGVYTRADSISYTSWSANIVGVADVDGDGDIDMVAQDGNYQFRVLKNDGSGAFTQTQSFSYSGADGSVAGVLPVGDWDGDGDMDAATMNYSSPNVSILLNNFSCPTVSVSPALLANGTQNASYSQSVSASGGTSPYSYAITTGSLPAGLSLNGSGFIAGTPTNVGTSYFDVTATDANGCTGVVSCTLTVAPGCAEITLSPSTLPNGTDGSAYSQTLTSSGGISPYTYAVTSGSLPAGLTLSSGGVLSGTPTADGAATFTVTATDSNGCTGVKEYTLTIEVNCLTGETVDQQQLMTASGYTNVQANQMVAQTFTAGQNGTLTKVELYLDRQNGYDYTTSSAVSSGDLIVELQSVASSTTNSFGGNCGTLTRQAPSGTVLSSTTVSLSDIPLNTPAFYAVTLSSPLEVTAGQVYAIVLRNTGIQPVDGSPGSYHWYQGRGASESNLYAGGSAFAKQTSAGTWNISEAVQPNSCNFTIYDDFAFKTSIGSGITVSPSSLSNGTSGIAYSDTLTATGGVASYTFAVTDGSLPAGLTLSTAGVVSGTPTESGTFYFSATATDANGCTGVVSCTLVVAPGCAEITLSPSTLPNGTDGSAYSQTLTSSGGISPYTYAVTSGSLPAGLTLSSGGVLSGTPTADGAATFTVTATDSNGCTGVKEYTLTIEVNCLTGETVDQQQLMIASGYTNVQANQMVAQTFTAGQNGSLTKVELYLDRQNGYDYTTSSAVSSGDLIVELQSVASSTTNSFGGNCGTLTRQAPSGTVLNSTTVSLSDIPLNTPAFYAVTLSSPLEVTAGQVYAIVLRNTGIQPVDGSPGSYHWYQGRGASESNLYAGGSAFAKQTSAGTWNISEAVQPNSCNFTIYDDFAFKTSMGSGITVSPSSLSNGTSGIAYSDTLTATGGVASYTFTVTGGSLPAGLTLSTSGVVSGTPTESGTFYFSVTATDANGCTGVVSCTLVVAPGCAEITLSPSMLPNGTDGSAYSQTLTASGGISPYTYAVTSGSLPAGLTLSSGGVLSGTSTADGAATFTVTATDSNGCTGVKEYTLTIEVNCLTGETVDQQQLMIASGYTNVQANQMVAQTFTAGQNGTLTKVELYLDRQNGYDYTTSSAVSSGDLIVELQSVASSTTNSFGGNCGTLTRQAPSGTVLSSTTVSLSDIPLNTPAFYAVTLSSPLEVTAGQVYAIVLRNTGIQPVDGSPGSYHWYQGRGASESNLYTGGSAFAKQTSAGTWNISEAVQPNSCNFTIYDDFAFKTSMGSGITVSPSSLSNGTSGIAYSDTLTATGGVASYTFAVTDGSLPAGLTLSTSGVVSGTPTESGTFYFSATATDANGCTGSGSITLVINTPALGSISGIKWNDLDGDGIIDETENGIAGWNIYLSGDRIDSTLTDSSGQYSFSGLAAGNYTVSEEQRSGWSQTFPESVTHSCTVAVGENVTQKNFGNKVTTEDAPPFTYDTPEILDGENEFCTPLIMNTHHTASETWFVKAFGGDLGVTLYAHAVNNVDPESVFVQVYDASSSLVTEFGVGYTGAEAASSGIGFEKSIFVNIGGRSPGEILRFVVTTPAPTPPTQPHYRFHFGGAVSAAINSPGFPGFEEEYARWYFNVQSAEDLNLDFFTTDMPTPADTMVVRIVDPAGAYHASSGLYPVDGTTEINIPGALSGVWSVAVEHTNGHYRLNKTTGTDRGVYLGQFSGGCGEKVVNITHNGSPSTGIPVSITMSHQVATPSGLEYLPKDSIFTDSSSFTFEKLPSGFYKVEVRPMNPGYSTPAAQFDTLLCDSVLVNSFNFDDLTGAISGMKFEDKNGNGLKDPSDNGLAGWVIRLDGELTDTTDANGEYSFLEVPVGMHTVTEMQQEGWIQTAPDTGFYSVEITGSGSVTNLNFGNFQKGSITGFKWQDMDADANADGGEPRLADWTIYLSGAASETTMTDENGNYSFTDLGPGTYSVSEKQEEGWEQVFPEGGSHTVALQSGQTASNKNFGNTLSFQPASISGIKFNDIDGDGTKDDGEPALQGWVISAAKDAATKYDTTDVNGAYSFGFEEAELGAWIISEASQSGWVQTFPLSGTHSIDVTEGLNATGVNFGNFKTPTISGVKFLDSDGDGVFDDSESGLAGWTIKATKGLAEKTDVTDVNGAFSFSFNASETGTWVISEVQQPGWMQTAPAGGTFEYNVVSALEVGNALFGNFQSGSISGKKYNDFTGDSATAGDPTLNNWVIRLYNDTLLVATDTTTGAGDYEFSSLAPGNYAVQEELKSGWIQTFPASGSYAVTISSGANVTGKDFANFELGSISGTKFLDFDGDTLKDAGESGMANWMILLTRGENQDTLITDENGNYSFTGLMAGSYTVTEVMNDGWYQTMPGSGSYVVTINSGSNEPNRNFGNFEFGSISGIKYWDRDSNAVKDAQCETYLGGIKMVLLGTHTPPDTAVTDVNGNFMFDNVPADNFTLTEAADPLWRQTFPANGAPYLMTMVSGLDTGGFVFGNFHMPDTLKFRTFILSDYNKASRAKQKSGFIRNPTAGNVRDTVFWRKGFGLDTPSDSGFLRIGVKRPDSSLHYGWLFHRWEKFKGPAVKHWIYNMKIWGTKRDPKTKQKVPRNPAFYFGFVGEKVTETYFGNAGNHLTVEMTTLKTNVAASDLGITPAGLGDLLYVCRDNTVDSLFNGMTIREIIRRADTAVTMGRLIRAVGDTVYRHPVSYLNALDSAISRINNEFRAVTVDTISSKPLKIKGVKGLYKVSYLMRDSLAPAPLAHFESASAADLKPSTYRLEQNYPNPFNPTTTIEFELMAPSKVTLRIYNLLGQQVGTILDNQELEEGIQFIELDAADLPSGVYFYRLEANGADEDGQQHAFKSVKKMLLLK